MTDIIGSEMLAATGFIRFAMSTRLGGVSAEPYGMNISYRVGDSDDHVTANRRNFYNRIGIAESRLALPGQCHSAKVVKIDSGGLYESCDGLVSDEPGIWLGVTVADCVPVILADPKSKAVAAVHAGWRGTLQGIVGNAVRLMSGAFGTKPKDLVAFLGPSAGVCCYEVGAGVAEKFSSGVLERKNGASFLDLKKENSHQLRDAGVAEERIETSSYCTICTPGLFHSFRRDKERSGRMLAVVGILS